MHRNYAARELLASFFYCTSRACAYIYKLESLGELKSYADGTVEGTSQAEVPSTEGPLGYMVSRIARVCWWDLIVLSHSNIASENVQLRFG